jgi:hypothetical protein
VARSLILRVEVLEADEHGNMTCIASHTERYPAESDAAPRTKLCECAYEGFDLARVKFYGLTDSEAAKLRGFTDKPSDEPSTH